MLELLYRMRRPMQTRDEGAIVSAIVSASDPSVDAQTFHGTIAVQHFGPKLGKTYQALALLSFMWVCIPDPWEHEPKIFLSASRLSWLVESRSLRSRLIARLVKIGAIKKASKPTRAGTAYVMLRPEVGQLSKPLRDALANMSPRDYRHNPNTAPVARAEATDAPASKPKNRKRKRGRTSRKELTANNTVLGKDWRKLAAALEQVCELPKNTIRYKPGSRDVEAFSAWLLQRNILGREFNKLCALVRDGDDRPEGYALRFVFEEDTTEKYDYLQRVLAVLRPKVPIAEVEPPT